MAETETPKKCPDCGALASNSGPEPWTACGRFLRANRHYGSTWTRPTTACLETQLSARDETIRVLKAAMPPSVLLRRASDALICEDDRRFRIKSAVGRFDIQTALCEWADIIEAAKKEVQL
jgi:hypothetical protein